MIYLIDGCKYQAKATTVFYGRPVVYIVTSADGSMVGKIELDEPQEYWIMSDSEGAEVCRFHVNAFPTEEKAIKSAVLILAGV